MLPDPAGIKPSTSWSPVRGTSDWSTKAGMKCPTLFSGEKYETYLNMSSVEYFTQHDNANINNIQKP